MGALSTFPSLPPRHPCSKTSSGNAVLLPHRLAWMFLDVFADGEYSGEFRTRAGRDDDGGGGAE